MEEQVWTRSTLSFAAAALVGQFALAGAGTRSPLPGPERCMTSEEHEASLGAAIRMQGRSAILTHTEHPSICKDGVTPNRRGQARD